MDDRVFADLHNKAEEFGSIARLVNESSRLRKMHSERAISLIRQSLEIGDVLNQQFEIISRANKSMRDQDTKVQNYCYILASNINHQKELIAALNEGSSVDAAALSRLEEITDNLSESLQKAIVLLHIIIQNDNEIILLDDLIIDRKRFQRESLDQLKKLSLRTLEDADIAIRGSSSNLQRGLQLMENILNVRQYIEKNVEEELVNLIEEARTGWNIETTVNKSSITQMVFAEEVIRFIDMLHGDSIDIRNLVLEKHKLFSRNLELTTELTVILSLEIKDFLPARGLFDERIYAPHLPKEARNLIGNLISYVAVACRDINFVSNLNFDMTDSINLNADLEKKSIDLTKMILDYFQKIREEVQNMNRATKYPIEGSAKNIENGKLIESYLRLLLKRIT
ncbi:MAG: hypothetical protein JW807_03410 [Spirochaetes bacterium]|nr:hypothetical protein [Spirochaetota bacterium]